MLLEGTHLLQEVLRQGNAPEEIIATEAWLQCHPALAERCPQARWRIVTDEVLRAALTTVTPDGVACLSPLDRLPTVPPEQDFLLVLDRIQDPGNLGTLLRTALAADINAVWMGLALIPSARRCCGPLPVLCFNCRINVLARVKRWRFHSFSRN